jgi:hypothetical protein
MPSCDEASRGEKLGMLWRNRKKISQIIKDHLYLPFFLLIILWVDTLVAHPLSTAALWVPILTFLKNNKWVT